jgi:hypothetical protein
MSVLYSFKGGVYYIHKGVHQHPQQTHILHLSRDERARFEQIVFENPTAGPAALISGRNGLTGARQSVATISTVLLNQDRVKAELQALRGKSTRNFVDDFADFQRNHPGYVLYSQFEVQEKNGSTSHTSDCWQRSSCSSWKVLVSCTADSVVWRY